MKLSTDGELVIEDNTGFEVVESTISTANNYYIRTLVTKNMYSNKESSLVREIVSNAVDANRESGSDKPIILKRQYDEEDKEYYLTVRDHGFGMSPDFFKSVYMDWFNSTKRDSDDYIGCFGMGSKSPLAYRNEFYLTTWHKGICYEYMILNDVKGSAPLLNSYESDEPSGTEIKVNIIKGDEYKFQQAINSQLCYFDSIYVEGFDFDNEYTIYEADTFLVKDKSQYSSDLHIVLGIVPYPINFSELGIDTIYCSIGLKFAIGELQVTPSREQLQYNDVTRKLIKDRIELFKLEIKRRYAEQNKPIFDLMDYIDKSGKSAYLQFGDFQLGISHLIHKSVQHGLFHSVPYQPFYEYESIGVISGNKLLKNKYSDSLCSSVINNSSFILIDENTVFNKYINQKIYDKFNRDVTVFQKTKFTLTSWKNALGHTFQRTNANGTRPYKNVQSILGIAYYIRNYQQYVKSYFSHLIFRYDSFTITAKDIEDYKILYPSVAAIKAAKKTTISYSTDSSSNLDTTIGDLLKYKYVFYQEKKVKSISTFSNFVNYFSDIKYPYFSFMGYFSKTNIELLESNGVNMVEATFHDVIRRPEFIKRSNRIKTSFVAKNFTFLDQEICKDHVLLKNKIRKFGIIPSFFDETLFADFEVDYKLKMLLIEYKNYSKCKKMLECVYYSCPKWVTDKLLRGLKIKHLDYGKN